MAVPRLRDPHPFRVLDPKQLSQKAKALGEAATIRGALKHGRVVVLDELPEIDLVLSGSVAVNLSGARVGKGGGYHDLPCDMIATPRAVIEIERQYDRPRGILWDHLQAPQIREVPVLERMGYA
jgi:5-formyltetrahydrofolate cyclo-ligase